MYSPIPATREHHETNNNTEKVATMLKLNEPNVARINQLWIIHHKEGSPDASECLACLLDERFVESHSMQWRIALSFGHNPFTPEMACGFIPPPVHPGKYVFGLHMVATKNDQLTLYDQWMEGFESGDDGDIDKAVVHGEQLLKAITPDAFLVHVLEDPHAIDRTIQYRLSVEPDVVQGEAF